MGSKYINDRAFTDSRDEARERFADGQDVLPIGYEAVMAECASGTRIVFAGNAAEVAEYAVVKMGERARSEGEKITRVMMTPGVLDAIYSSMVRR